MPSTPRTKKALSRASPAVGLAVRHRHRQPALHGSPEARVHDVRVETAVALERLLQAPRDRERLVPETGRLGDRPGPRGSSTFTSQAEAPGGAPTRRACSLRSYQGRRNTVLAQDGRHALDRVALGDAAEVELHAGRANRTVRRPGRDDVGVAHAAAQGRELVRPGTRSSPRKNPQALMSGPTVTSKRLPTRGCTQARRGTEELFIDLDRAWAASRLTRERGLSCL